MDKLVVHMIGNAHLDPVWLWSWQEGVDEVLSTTYTVVNLLKEYPEFIFTRSDVWFHKVIERLDPKLFREVQRFVEEGRWSLVGGWYVQPDCIFPTEYGFKKHIEIGKRYFKEKFGKDIKIGYNVDGFGHTGSLPRILKEAGYVGYVHKRPEREEKNYSVDSNIFWWEASDSADRIITYRIPTGYSYWEENLGDHIKATVDQSDVSLGHIMCFYGIGDHGGGPSRREIEYILENKDKFAGIELRFSHPEAYFDAIAEKVGRLPVVKGELLHHAVGCYSISHLFKKNVKDTEHKLVTAEQVINNLSDYSDKSDANRLTEAWEDVLFVQFHDTLGGTCVKRAYPDMLDRVGRARAIANELIAETVRRKMRNIGQVKIDESVKLVMGIYNPYEEEYRGWWEQSRFGVLMSKRGKSVKVIDSESGGEIPAWLTKPESPHRAIESIIFPVKIPSKGYRLFTIKELEPSEKNRIISDLSAGKDEVHSTKWSVVSENDGIMIKANESNEECKLRWCVYDDPTDTWGHSVYRLGVGTEYIFKRIRSFVEENTPLRVTLTWIGEYGRSIVRIRVKLYLNERKLEMLINVRWNENRKILKMKVTPGDAFVKRYDGISGGHQVRDMDGKEYPFVDWIFLSLKNGNNLVVISSDIFGVDVTEKEIRLTLVRSPIYAHFETVEIDENTNSYDFMDIGEQEYKLHFMLGHNINLSKAKKVAKWSNRELISWNHFYKVI